MGAVAGERRGEFADAGIVADEADAIDRIGERAGALEQHLLARVVEPDLLLQLDPARPMRGEDLGRLLGAQRARVDQHFGQRVAVRQHGGDTPRVVAAAVGQRALIIVLPESGSRPSRDGSGTGGAWAKYCATATPRASGPRAKVAGSSALRWRVLPPVGRRRGAAL